MPLKTSPTHHFPLRLWHFGAQNGYLMDYILTDSYASLSHWLLKTTVSFFFYGNKVSITRLLLTKWLMTFLQKGKILLIVINNKTHIIMDSLCIFYTCSDNNLPKQSTRYLNLNSWPIYYWTSFLNGAKWSCPQITKKNGVSGMKTLWVWQNRHTEWHLVQTVYS